MKIDFRSDPDASAVIARVFELVDLDTGRRPPEGMVFRADEATGECQAFTAAPGGGPVMDPETGEAVADPPFFRRVRFVPRPGCSHLEPTYRRIFDGDPALGLAPIHPVRPRPR